VTASVEAKPFHYGLAFDGSDGPGLGKLRYWRDEVEIRTDLGSALELLLRPFLEIAGPSEQLLDPVQQDADLDIAIFL
jgi:hypothetical protein